MDTRFFFGYPCLPDAFCRSTRDKSRVDGRLPRSNRFPSELGRLTIVQFMGLNKERPKCFE